MTNGVEIKLPKASVALWAVEQLISRAQNTGWTTETLKWRWVKSPEGEFLIITERTSEKARRLLSAKSGSSLDKTSRE